jgi:hypothetical protein
MSNNGTATGGGDTGAPANSVVVDNVAEDVAVAQDVGVGAGDATSTIRVEEDNGVIAGFFADVRLPSKLATKGIIFVVLAITGIVVIVQVLLYRKITQTK